MHLNIFSRIQHSNTVKDALWLFVLQGIDKIMPLIIVPYLMIILGADKYGYVGFSFAAIQYLMLIVDFGFNFSATKRISIAHSKGADHIFRIVSCTFLAKLILFTGSTPLLLLIVYYVPSINCYFSTVLCMLTMVFGSILNAGWLFQGMGKIRVIAIVTSLCKIVILPLTFVFVKDSSDYNLAALIQGSVFFISGVISFFIACYYGWIKFIKVSHKDLKLEISESFPLFLSSAAGSTYTQLFTIILGLTSNSAVVGTYSAADRIMRTVCLSIYHPIMTAFYPKLAKLGFEAHHQGELLVSKISKLLFVMMVGVGLILFVFSEPISRLIGSSYIGLDRLIQIMSITPVFIALGGVYGQMGLLALGEGNAKRKFRNVYLYAAPLSLFLVSVLTWWFAETGAAVAMVLTEVFIFFGMFISIKRLHII